MARYSQLTPEQWNARIDYFRKALSPCQLCPRECGADRKKNRSGVCQAGNRIKIASYNLHFGEEPPISGSRGSGTVFFSGCTLKCCFCQNYPISQFNTGGFYDIDQLAGIMLFLQKKGAHNINLVSPTPYVAHFVQGLYRACQNGLTIPIVYNTGGYERVEIVRNLDCLVDVYMPDFKYSDNSLARRLSGVGDYVVHARASLKQMFRQTGSLVLDERGIATGGLLIRHLILPGQLDNSREVLRILAEDGLTSAYLGLMSQYFPAHKASDTDINRRITGEEYREVKKFALAQGFTNGWFQDI